MKRPKLATPARLRAAAGLLGALLCAGCAGFNVREELGIVGQGPDEFTVVKKKPLEMPTDMSALPEPEPGAPSLVDPTPERDAQIALTGHAQDVAASGSSSEASLLQAAGAGAADPEIRKKLKEDEESVETRLLDSILPSSREEDRTLDPEEEAARLAEEARKSKNPGLEPLPAKE